MTARLMLCGVLVVLGVFIGRATMAHSPQGQVIEQELLNNDSVRIVLLTYPPGADSDLHLNVGPEITIVQEGELPLCEGKAGGAPAAQRPLAPGGLGSPGPQRGQAPGQVLVHPAEAMRVTTT